MKAKLPNVVTLVNDAGDPAAAERLGEVVKSGSGSSHSRGRRSELTISENRMADPGRAFRREWTGRAISGLAQVLRRDVEPAPQIEVDQVSTDARTSRLGVAARRFIVCNHH